MSPTDVAKAASVYLGRSPSEPGTARLADAIADPFAELPEVFREAAILFARYGVHASTIVAFYKCAYETGRNAGHEEGCNLVLGKLAGGGA